MEQNDKSEIEVSKSNGTFKRIIIRALCIFLVLFIYFIFFHPTIIPPSKQLAKPVVCQSYIRYITLGLLLYNTDKTKSQYPTVSGLPNKSKWNELIFPYIEDERPYVCPSEKLASKTCTYVLNQNLYDIKGELPEDMVLIFEGAVGWNQVGDADDIVFRHGREGQKKCAVGLVDGSVMRVDREEAKKLKWTKEIDPQI